jgi:hypothetical protein
VNHFAWFQDDGFIKTGCFNTNCPGFQPEKGAPIAPGDAIGDKRNLNLKIVKVHNIPYEFVFCYAYSFLVPSFRTGNVNVPGTI